MVPSKPDDAWMRSTTDARGRVILGASVKQLHTDPVTWQWQLVNGPLNWPEWTQSSTHYEALPVGMTPQQWATRYYDPSPYFIKRSVLLEEHHDYIASPSLLTSIDEYEVEEVLLWPGVRLNLSLDLIQTWQVHDAETGVLLWGGLYPNVSLNDKLAAQHSYQYEVTTQTYRESYSDEVTALLPEAPLGQVPPHGLTQSASGPLTNPADGWSPAALTPVDAPLQALASGGETIPFEPIRLPTSGGIVATAKTELEKRPMHHLADGGQPQLLDRWQGSHSQGKVALAWRTDISDALTPAVMQNWIDRFQVLIEETVSPADGSPTVTTSTSRPLADFLQAIDVGPQMIGELNVDSLAGTTDNVDREVRLSLVCSVPTRDNPLASAGAGTSGTTAGVGGQSGGSNSTASYVLHMEMPTIEAYVSAQHYTLNPPYESATYSYSVVKRSSKEPHTDFTISQTAKLYTAATNAEIEHLPALQSEFIEDQQGYYQPHKPDVDDPLGLIGERSFPSFDTYSVGISNGVRAAYSRKSTSHDIAYAYPYEPGGEEIGTHTWYKQLEARCRLRLRAKAPLMLGGQPVNLPQGYKATFLPVVEVRNLLPWGGESDQVETKVLPPLVMEIPPGDSASAIRNVDTLPQLSQHLPAQTNTVVQLRLLPVDLDIVHPATGELEEGKQHDASKGGYVAVRRDDKTPVTKLVLRQGSNVSGMKYKVKFNGADKFKLWKDEARTEAVVSQQTEFDPAHETTLYFEGLKKSASVGGETLTLQAVINGTSTDAETLYATIVEAEFDVWLNMFIPPQWGDLPALHPIHTDVIMVGNNLLPVYRRKIFGGDDRSFATDFLDTPTTDVDDPTTSSRAHSQVVIIPFKDLDADGIKDNTAKSAMGESHNYLKSASVPDPSAGYSTSNRLVPQPVITQTGRAPTSDMHIDGATRYGTDNNAVKFKFHGSADNPIVSPSASIDWDFEIAISVNNSNVLAPKWLLSGHKQDGFPAYEIYVRDSDGSSGDEKGTPVYQYDPIPLGRTPEDLFPAPVGADETVLPANGTIP